jgi:hypothetical protein
MLYRGVRWVADSLLELVLSWAYRLRLRCQPVLLSQSVRRKTSQHLASRVGCQLMDRRTRWVIILTVLALSDIFFRWSDSAATAAGLYFLKALLERALQILLPLMGFLVPLFILAFNSLRSRLGPHLTDLAIRKLGLFQLLATGIGLGALLGTLLSLWSRVGPSVEVGALSAFLVRITVWLLALYVFFLWYLILWLWRMLRLLNTESVFSFLVPFVTSGFNAWCQNQGRAKIAASEMESFCQGIGIQMIPFSSLGNSIVIAHRSG